MLVLRKRSCSGTCTLQLQKNICSIKRAVDATVPHRKSRSVLVLSSWISSKTFLKGPFINFLTTHHTHNIHAVWFHAVSFCRTFGGKHGFFPYSKLRISWANVQTSSGPNCAPSDHAPQTPGHPSGYPIEWCVTCAGLGIGQNDQME